jgi:steroid 5-alpha reductase family enzyme
MLSAASAPPLAALLQSARAALLARGAPPVASALQPFVLVALLNALGWAASAALRTGHLFDLTGAASFAAAAGYALALGPAAARPRAQLAAAALALWAARLGSFLFARVVRAGKDARLDAYVAAPARFAFLFAVQTAWVFVTALPVLLLCSVPALAAAAEGDAPFAPAAGAPALAMDVCGALAFALGLAVEVLADEQKRRFHADARNAGRFIDSGLWRLVQHPNYAGEMLLQAGLAAFCLPGLLRASSPRAPWALAALSPLFEALLLVFVSGVPPLQRAGDKRWGAEPAYVAYRERTPLFLPWPLGAAPGPGAVKKEDAAPAPASAPASAPTGAPARAADGGTPRALRPAEAAPAARRMPGASDIYTASSRSRDASVRPATMAREAEKEKEAGAAAGAARDGVRERRKQ